MSKWAIWVTDHKDVVKESSEIDKLSGIFWHDGDLFMKGTVDYGVFNRNSGSHRCSAFLEKPSISIFKNIVLHYYGK